MAIRSIRFETEDEKAYEQDITNESSTQRQCCCNPQNDCDCKHVDKAPAAWWDCEAKGLAFTYTELNDDSKCNALPRKCWTAIDFLCASLRKARNEVGWRDVSEFPSMGYCVQSMMCYKPSDNATIRGGALGTCPYAWEASCNPKTHTLGLSFLAWPTTPCQNSPEPARSTFRTSDQVLKPDSNPNEFVLRLGQVSEPDSGPKPATMIMEFGEVRNEISHLSTSNFNFLLSGIYDHVSDDVNDPWQNSQLQSLTLRYEDRTRHKAVKLLDWAPNTRAWELACIASKVEAANLVFEEQQAKLKASHRKWSAPPAMRRMDSDELFREALLGPEWSMQHGMSKENMARVKAWEEKKDDKLIEIADKIMQLRHRRAGAQDEIEIRAGIMCMQGGTIDLTGLDASLISNLTEFADSVNSKVALKI